MYLQESLIWIGHFEWVMNNNFVKFLMIAVYIFLLWLDELLLFCRIITVYFTGIFCDGGCYTIKVTCTTINTVVICFKACKHCLLKAICYVVLTCNYQQAMPWWLWLQQALWSSTRSRTISQNIVFETTIHWQGPLERRSYITRY